MTDNNQSSGTANVGEFKYSAILIDHARNPRNVDIAENYNGFALNDGYCGDMMSMWVRPPSGSPRKNDVFRSTRLSTSPRSKPPSRASRHPEVQSCQRRTSPYTKTALASAAIE